MTTTDDDLEEGRIIRCTRGTPIAELKDGQLVIKARHHGETHVSRLPLTLLAPRPRPAPHPN